MTGMSRRPLAVGVLLALTGLMYLPLLMHGGFVLDDIWYVQGNPQLLDWNGLKAIWSWSPETRLRSTPGVEYQYWPVTYTSFWLDYKVWQGFSGQGFHATNVAVHMANTWLLWRLLDHLRAPGAAAVAAVFALHPSQLDTLGQIIGRKDLLSTLCVIGALLLWARAAKATGWATAAAAGLLLGAGVLAKTTAGAGVALLVLLHAWQGRGWGWAAWSRLAVAMAPACAVAAIAIAVHATKMGDVGYRDYGQADRLMMGAIGWWTHLWYSLVPDPAGLGWRHWELGWTEPRVFASVGGLMALGAVLWIWRERLPRALPYGVAAFTVMLSPYLGLVDSFSLPASMHNARYRYLALAVPWIGVAAVWIRLEARWARRWKLRARRMAAVLAGCAVLVVQWDYGFAFSSNAAWWKHLERTSLGHSPRTVGLARDKAVLDLVVEGRIEEALQRGREQQKRYPEAPRSRFGLGMTLEIQGQLGDEEAAEEAFRVLSGIVNEWASPGERGRKLGRDGPWGVRAGGWGPQALGPAELKIAWEGLARMEAARGERARAERTMLLSERVKPRPGKRGWMFLNVGGGIRTVEAEE